MSQPQVMSRTPRNHSHLTHSGLLDFTESSMQREALSELRLPTLTWVVKQSLPAQKQQLIPELCEHSMVSAALAEADDRHWNVTNDPIYPVCLEGFRRRHESSQASQASKSAERSGTGGGSPTCVTTPPSTTSSQALFTLTLGAHEIRGIVCDTLDQVYALRLETLQEMGFIREVDRAIAKSIMAEFLRLQLIGGDDLNTSLRAMYADLEATTAELYSPHLREPCNRSGPPQIYGSDKTETGPPIDSGGRGLRGYGEVPPPSP